MGRLAAWSVLAGLLAAAGGAQASVGPLRAPARVEQVERPTEVRSYTAVDAAGEPLADARWRVVEQTGNCCENYLAATADGHLLDLGGGPLWSSPDAGFSWTRISPPISLSSAEGAVSAAPGGDVVAATWDPYQGDRVVSYTYDAAAQAWYAGMVPIHTPFFDRPWIAVVPGPVTIGGDTAPYVTILKGGYPSKEIYWYSLDGLDYTNATTPALAALANGSVPMNIGAFGEADVLQPLTRTGVTPVQGVGALVERAVVCPLARLDLDGRWSCVMDRRPDAGRMLADSLGRLHVVSMFGGEFDYSVSENGGRAWDTVTVPLPAGHEADHWDFKAHAAAGVAAVAVHARRVGAAAHQDLVVRLDISGSTPRPERVSFVGDGDLETANGAGATRPRYDFATVAILPDGRVATSFADVEHHPPAVAIELP